MRNGWRWEGDFLRPPSAGSIYLHKSVPSTGRIADFEADMRSRLDRLERHLDRDPAGLDVEILDVREVLGFIEEIKLVP